MEMKNLCLLVVALILNLKVDCSYAATSDVFDVGQEHDLGAGKMWKNFNKRQEDNEIKKFDSDVNEELVRQAETIADEDLLSGLNTILKNNETLEDVMKIEGITNIP